MTVATAEQIDIDQVDFGPFEAQFEATPSINLSEPGQFIDADAIPELYQARQEAAQEAGRILLKNQVLLANGQTEAVPIAVDVLGTAKRVVEAKRLFGVDSPQYQELNEGLVLDCERVVGEAERKLTWELFGDAEQPLDPETETYFAHGVSLPVIVTGGLTPLARPEESDRRVNEFVEEVGTYTTLGRMIRGLGEMASGQTVSSYEISECTDEASADYILDPKGAHGGYVPEIQKFMAREVIFKASGDRIERQLALSGEYITPEVIRTVLLNLELISSKEISKTELHGKQFIDTSSRGLLWLGKQFDQEASRQSGKRIFMGEEVGEDHPMRYEDIPLEAEARRERLAPKPRELADHIIQLEENGTDREVAEGLVNSYLRQMLLEVAKNDPDKAEVMFNKETADGFRVANMLEDLGRHKEAKMLRTEVENNAPEVVYCGGGSCGLEVVAANSALLQLAKSLGLNTEAGDVLLDTERACINCHHTNVILYDGLGNKGCSRCHSTQINGKISGGTKDSVELAA